MNLLQHDVEMFGKLGILPELLDRAGIVRVTDRQAREEYGITGDGDMAGIAYPYWQPATMMNGSERKRWYVRIRRDTPDADRKKKYVAPYADRRPFYFPPCPDWFVDADAAVCLVEADPSALSLLAWCERVGGKLVPVAIGGCWGWRGRIGKVDSPKGGRVDEKGPLPELSLICHKDRTVYVLFDSNSNHNPTVRAARAALSRELVTYGARVLIGSIPALPGVNGPDDLLEKVGDSGIASILELAVPALDLAVADAESLIAQIKQAHPKLDPETMRAALDAVADVTDELQRQVLQGRLAEAVRGVVPKKILVDEVAGRRATRQQKEEDFAVANRCAELLRQPVDSVQLISDMEAFFAERAYLPEGAALCFAYFVLNSRVFDLFDATPYVCLESATPRCGKSTVIRMLVALSAKALVVTSMNEAIFRLLDQQHPPLCIDEAELLEGRSERAEALRAILNEGYKRGGRVPRCVGEEHEVQFFDVYSPKVFSAIGGLSGALLDRCIVIHMERAPKGGKRKSTRIRAIAHDSKMLVEKLDAYALQFRDELQRLYDA